MSGLIFTFVLFLHCGQITNPFASTITFIYYHLYYIRVALISCPHLLTLCVLIPPRGSPGLRCLLPVPSGYLQPVLKLPQTILLTKFRISFILLSQQVGFPVVIFLQLKFQFFILAIIQFCLYPLHFSLRLPYPAFEYTLPFIKLLSLVIIFCGDILKWIIYPITGTERVSAVNPA